MKKGDPIVFKSIIREYCKKLYVNIFNILGKMDEFLEKYFYQNGPKKK